MLCHDLLHTCYVMIDVMLCYEMLGIVFGVMLRYVKICYLVICYVMLYCGVMLMLSFKIFCCDV